MFVATCDFFLKGYEFPTTFLSRALTKYFRMALKSAANGGFFIAILFEFGQFKDT